MDTQDNVIAWLVPTARGTYADKATNKLENRHLSTSTTAEGTFLSSRLPALSANTPTKALAISFNQAPKRPGSFVLGTDPERCDVVLPAIAGVSSQHCSLSFDAESRLVLNDFSEKGTQVWYDWDSNGDQTEYTWILSSGSSHGFPALVNRILIDVQGVRFQIIVNDHSKNWDAYHERVEKFCQQPAWAAELSVGWDRASVAPVAPLFSVAPLFQHIFVKSLNDDLAGGMYLWNLTKPWEPMVKAAA
jgi:hypothetical protein